MIFIIVCENILLLSLSLIYFINVNLTIMIVNYEPIEKEFIQSLRFPKTDVLDDVETIYQRTSDLNRAQALGNLEHSKIKIFFEDNDLKRVVETTVWAVTDNSVILKRGVRIPINRIFKSI